LARVHSVTQVANEFEIFKEEVPPDGSDHRCEKSGVPVQKLPESPFFVFCGRASKSFAEQGLERQVSHIRHVKFNAEAINKKPQAEHEIIGINRTETSAFAIRIQVSIVSNLPNFRPKRFQVRVR
jgi:hypothetical protein